MPGFIVSYKPSSKPVEFDESAVPDLHELGIVIVRADAEPITTERNCIALVDGYALGVSTRQLVAALEAEDDDLLSRVHGHYSVVIIDWRGTVRGYCDRFGAGSLYWQSDEQGQVVISSRWHVASPANRRWDDSGLSEMLQYRWMSGQPTLLTGISQLPHWKRVLFRRDGEVSVSPTRQQPKWPVRFPARPFAEKLQVTRSALRAAFDEIANSYDNAAVFLSGGVDSSLLAAFARSSFRKCVLVTPVFSGENNPELLVAKAIAGALHLEHRLVEIDESRLEQDLRELVQGKGGQVKFHALAMYQMIDAIPEDCRLIVYGEGADTLFGAAPFGRIENLLLLKRFVDAIPNAALQLAAKLPIRRVDRLMQLKKMTKMELALQHFQIPYKSREKAIIRDLCRSPLDDIYAHQAARLWLTEGAGPFYRTLQDIALTIDCTNHFREIDLMSVRSNKRVFSPFMSQAVIDAAITLTRDQYFGDGFVKPVLRELACEHYERNLIYKEKHGFEVPYASWLKGPLAAQVEAVRRQRLLFDGQLLDDLDVDNHYPLFWTLISWQILDEKISAQSKVCSLRSPEVCGGNIKTDRIGAPPSRPRDIRR